MSEEELKAKLDALEKALANKEDKKQLISIFPKWSTPAITSSRKSNAVVDMIQEMATLGRTVVFEPIGGVTIQVSVVDGNDVGFTLVTIKELVEATYPGAVIARAIKTCSHDIDSINKNAVESEDVEF